MSSHITPLLSQYQNCNLTRAVQHILISHSLDCILLRLIKLNRYIIVNEQTRAQQPPPRKSLNVLYSSDAHSILSNLRAASGLSAPG